MCHEYIDSLDKVNTISSAPKEKIFSELSSEEKDYKIYTV